MHKTIAKTILSPKNEINIYKGCTHGCIYCSSRIKFNSKLDGAFEDIEVKENAPELLEQALKKKKEKCMIIFGSVYDPYNPVEKELEITRRCLEIIDRYEFGATILTKSDLVLRDLDVLKSINKKAKCIVQMSVTCAEDKLSTVIEPNVCPTTRRIEVLKEFKANGIGTVLWMTPLLPYINDTEANIKSILNLCLDAKVNGLVYYGPGLTLREGNKEYFYKMLDKNFPILRRRYQREFKNRYEVYQNCNVARFDYIIKDFCEKNEIKYELEDVFYYLENLDSKIVQLSLFDEDDNKN